MKTNIWDKGNELNEKVRSFTIGDDSIYDEYLIIYDLLASKAHAKMLSAVGIINRAELKDLLFGLDELKKRHARGLLNISPDFEDMHSRIEFELIEMLGETGKKIHTGRSRNDQVLVAIHLFVKDQLCIIKERTFAFFELLLHLSEKHKNDLMPGYTHLQIAMPSSFGLWFGAYAELLIDDMAALGIAYNLADQNPLGSAAGYGSSFPIDRELTTELLGFSTLKYNVIAAQMSRGRLEMQVANALSGLAATIGKMADDVCLYLSQNFNLFRISFDLSTGSSIMPHKQNPDIFELMRAHCNKIKGVPQLIGQITGNMSSGYFRDYQLLKPELIKVIEETKAVLDIASFAVPFLEVNKMAIDQKMYDNLFSVEAINDLVKKGQSFRSAYQKVAQDISENVFIPNRKVKHVHQGSIGNLCLEEISQKMKNELKKWK